jgi:hypothetical protein
VTGWILAAAVAVAVLAACGSSEPLGPQEPPRGGRAGLQLTGMLEGRQIAINDGAPRLVVGDCEPRRGPSQDVCFISRDIDGELFVLVVKNPAALAAGGILPIADPGCAAPGECEAVTDVAVIDVQVGPSPRRRAREGTLIVDAVDPGAHYAGTIRLRLADGGRLSGTFDVVPRRD